MDCLVGFSGYKSGIWCTKSRSQSTGGCFIGQMRAHDSCVKKVTKCHIVLILVFFLFIFELPMPCHWQHGEADRMQTCYRRTGVWQWKGCCWWWWWGVEVTLNHFLFLSHKISLSFPFTLPQFKMVKQRKWNFFFFLTKAFKNNIRESHDYDSIKMIEMDC